MASLLCRSPVAPHLPSVAYILIVLRKALADARGADRAKVTCGIEAGVGALVSYWEWSKLIALAFLISCALTATYIAPWLVLR